MRTSERTGRSKRCAAVAFAIGLFIAGSVSGKGLVPGAIASPTPEPAGATAEVERVIVTNGSVRFELRELNTVSLNHNSVNGTYDQKFFDANGNLVLEDKGKIHATRLSVDLF